MNQRLIKAADCGLAACNTCGKVSPATAGKCSRCGTRLHLRKPNSIQNTILLMIAATLLYIPSHLLPIMTVTELGDVTHNTIVSGMMVFWETGAYPIAIVIFTASILIPLLKIIALIWLCAAATGRVRPSPVTLGRLYWFTELLGRWSMIDIFVVGILVSIVQLGNYMTVIPGIGAIAFAGVVLLTMLAAMSFEPRLLWDRLDDMNPSTAPRGSTRESEL
jgi:paraquat-inducible protein A